MKIIPIFPLRIIAFPGELINLHIFEPRYKKLIKDILSGEKVFGISPFINERLAEIGTEVKLLNVEKEYPNGELDIKVEGAALYKIRNFYEGNHPEAYSNAQVEYLNLKMDDGEPYMNAEILKCLQQLFEILQLDRPLPESPYEFNSFDVGHLAGLDVNQEYELLCTSSEKDRQKLIYQHLKAFLPEASKMQRLRVLASLNGHFRPLRLE